MSSAHTRRRPAPGAPHRLHGHRQRAAPGRGRAGRARRTAARRSAHCQPPRARASAWPSESRRASPPACQRTRRGPERSLQRRDKIAVPVGLEALVEGRRAHLVAEEEARVGQQPDRHHPGVVEGNRRKPLGRQRTQGGAATRGVFPARRRRWPAPHAATDRTPPPPLPPPARTRRRRRDPPASPARRAAAASRSARSTESRSVRARTPARSRARFLSISR